MSEGFKKGDPDDPVKKRDDPFADIDDPFEDIEDPFEDIEDPFEDIDESSEDIDEPAEDIEDPAEDIDDPFADTDESFVDADEPFVDVDEPFETIDESPGDIDEPLAEHDEPPQLRNESSADREDDSEPDMDIPELTDNASGEAVPGPDDHDGEFTDSDGLEESTDEPDLLFANINALMEGSAAPASDPVNLDDHPYRDDDEVNDDIPVVEQVVTEAGDPLEDILGPLDDDDDYFPDTGDLDEAPYVAETVSGADSGDSLDYETQADDEFDDFEAPATVAATSIALADTAVDDPHTTIIELGFYGKLPTYGDFIQKRLPQNFINPWHEWLQAGMLAGREKNPGNWMTYYLNCPAWCFVLGAGICGDQPVAGVTIPSVDRVGRYFNFTMASMLPVNTDPAVFAASRQHWFSNLEQVALSALDQEMNQDEIEGTINDMSAELRWDPPRGSVFTVGNNQARIQNPESNGVSDLIPALLHQLISSDNQPYGLWWHRGSTQVTPQLLSCTGMPAGETYLDLIMDSDLRDTTHSAPDEPEMDYLDELLSD